MSILCSTKAMSNIYVILPADDLGNYVFNELSIHNRHFLPYRRADLTVSALLRRICGETPQLHPPRLASTATSTRE